MSRIELLGVEIDAIDRSGLLDRLSRWSTGAEPRTVCYVNVHALNLAATDSAFREILNRGDLVFCDGFGVKLGARLVGRDLPDRMTPPDWIDDFLMSLGPSPVFLLGDEPGVAEECSSVMTAKHAGLAIAGTHTGFFEINGEENQRLIRRINESKARVLLVGMGMPRQERWIDENRSTLNPSVVVSVGALFRWYAGVEQRAPRWFTDRGLEWLFRLVRHPIRHFRRYVVGNPLFVARVLQQRVSSRS